MKLKKLFSIVFALGALHFASTAISAEDIYADKVKVSLNSMNGDLKKCSGWLSSKLPQMAMPLMKNFFEAAKANIDDAKTCMLNEKLVGLSPYDMHEINNDDVDLQLLLLSIQDLQALHDKVISLMSLILADDFIPAYESITDIRTYFYQDASFISDLPAADKAIHECFNYTSKMVDNFPNVVPTPNDLKAKTGLKSYWHTSFFYNQIRIIYRQLSGYRASSVVKFEENAQEYKKRIADLKVSITNWQAQNVNKKTSGLSDYPKILIDFLDKIDRSIDNGLEMYNRRLDPNENVGRIFTGKIDLPYGHIKTFKDQVGATVYQKGYLSALGECQSSYEEAWKEIRNKYRSDHNKDTPIGRKLSEYAPLK